MSFAFPHALWALLVIASLAALDAARRVSVAALWPHIRRLWAGHAEVDLTSPLAAPRVRWYFWAGLAFLTLAIARPQWGALEVPVNDQPREVIVALDLSRSMLARDVRPSRLDHAKLLIQGMVDKMAGERVGLVLFARSSYMQLPLSTDYEILTNLLPSLSPDYFPQGGTNYEAMMNTVLESFSTAEGVERDLVVLSDGEAFDESWKPLAAQLKARGIRVLGVGIGTAGGGVIPAGQGVVRDSAGIEVMTRLKPATLEELSKATGGTYLAANTWIRLNDLIRRPRVDDGIEDPTKLDETKLADQFEWALIPALLLLALSYWREIPVRPTARDIKLPSGRGPVVAASLALLFALLASAPRARAQDMAETGMDMLSEPNLRSPMVQLSSMVSTRINQILASPNPGAYDYVSLVIDMSAYCENVLKARQRFPMSVIDDALLAIKRGEEIDPQGGAWDMLRANLATLRKANAEPWGIAAPDQAGKAEAATSFDPNNDMEVDFTKEGESVGGVGSSDSDAEAQQLRRNFAADAFGKMALEKREGEEEPPVPPTPPDTQLVGGGQSQTDRERDERPELVLPLQRLDYIRTMDAPAKLFQMLEGQKNYLVPQGPDW
ncbi:MAG TPA: VWA domain-containing protein [Opitutaceae bacterium]